MGIQFDADSTASPSILAASLPTPAQSPLNQPVKGLPTPFADSSGDIFDLTVSSLSDTEPPYTQAELEAALDNPPVPATIWYGTHILHGMFWCNTSLFSQLYERFHDISPADSPRLTDAGCKAWTLFNHIQGRTWVDETVLVSAALGTAQQPDMEPRFVAVTDSLEVLHRCLIRDPTKLGDINLHGSFETVPWIKAPNDIIIALPSNRPLLGYRNTTLGVPAKQMVRNIDVVSSGHLKIKDYPPAPTSAAVLDAVRTIHSAAVDSEIMPGSTPSKKWLHETLASHFERCSFPARDSASATLGSNSSTTPTPSSTTAPAQPTPQHRSNAPVTLSPTSPLWPHRGNEALFKRVMWQVLCYSSAQGDANIERKGGVKIPEPYWQVLFEDPQVRERLPGKGQRLKGLAWGRFGGDLWEGSGQSVEAEAGGQGEFVKVEGDDQGESMKEKAQDGQGGPQNGERGAQNVEGGLQKAEDDVEDRMDVD